MRSALARHDELTRSAVEQHHGRVVKTTGDGFHAAFEDPLDALNAVLQLQLALSDPGATAGVALHVRAGLHAGVDERRDNDYFGPVVNRAARIMASAHGGQILASRAVVSLLADRLPKDTALRDLGSVRLRDLANAEPVFQVTHPRLRMEFPALRSLEATPNNLPQQVTSFVGRDRELEEIKRLLKTTRLLTLVGTGGLGKTRLSLQAAADIIDHYPDGVWFVELAAITDEARVVQAVATVLGVREEPGLSLAHSLVRFLATRHLLIILDNCEHLVRACAKLCKDVLQSAPGVSVLASSREPLRVGGEMTYAVPPLSVPDPSRQWTQASLAHFEAAQLFVSRVAAVQPNFVFDDDSAHAIAEVCYRLDGIPLALELAAARAGSLPLRAIAGRLTDRFRLLSRGDRTALPRQQTLRALIDWSHELLTEHEQVLFRRLGTFAGGWTLEAAEAVCSAAPLDLEQVLDLLSQLVEKSLVVIEPLSGRYRFLDTIAQYARDRLQESTEDAAVRKHHIEHFRAFAEQARPALAGPEQARWLARLDDEFDNLIAAITACATSTEAAESGLKLASALRPYWIMRGLLGVGHARTLAALDHPGAAARTLTRCRALSDAGTLAYFMGNYPESRRLLDEGLAIAREIGDSERIRPLLHTSGMALMGEGDLSRARELLDEALVLAEASGNKHHVGAALNALGQLHRLHGDLDIAEDHYTRMIGLERDVGDRDAMAMGLLNLAIVAIGRNQRERAKQLLRDALLITNELGLRAAGQSVLEICAGLAVLEGDWQRAAFFYGAAEAQAALTSLVRDPSDEAFLSPLIDSVRQTIGAEAFAVATDEGRACEYAAALGAASTWLTD